MQRSVTPPPPLQRCGSMRHPLGASLRMPATHSMSMHTPRSMPVSQSIPQPLAASSTATVDFSGTYVDNFGETRTLVQCGSNGDCSAGWKFSVSGDTATIVGHGITGKFRSGDPVRKIDWTNGVTYKDSQSQAGSVSPRLPQSLVSPSLIPSSTNNPQPLAAPNSWAGSIAAPQPLAVPGALPIQQMLPRSLNMPAQHSFTGSGNMRVQSFSGSGNMKIQSGSIRLSAGNSTPIEAQKAVSSGEGAAEWYRRYSAQNQPDMAHENRASMNFQSMSGLGQPTPIEAQRRHSVGANHAQALTMMDQAHKNAEAELAAKQALAKSQAQSRTSPQMSITGPQFPFTLVCVDSPGAAVDINALPVEARSIGVREDVDTQVGKTMQPDLFIDLFADRPALAWISRIHCDMCPIADSPGKFTVMSRSPNGLRVNEKYVGKGESAKVRPPVLIDFLTTIDAGRTFELLCRWQFEPSHRIPWGCSGFAGGVQPLGPPPPLGEVPLPKECAPPLQGMPVHAAPTLAVTPATLPQSASSIAAYYPGEKVEAYYQNDAKWYGAKVESMQNDGSILIAWDDGAQCDRVKLQAQVRRPSTQAAVDFSGRYVDTQDGSSRILRQNGSEGECSIGWSYTVTGTVAKLVGHDITGKFRQGSQPGSRTIDWSNGVTYIEAASFMQPETPPSIYKQPETVPPPARPLSPTKTVPEVQFADQMGMPQLQPIIQPTAVQHQAEMVPVQHSALGEMTVQQPMPGVSGCPFWLELYGSALREDFPVARRKLSGHHGGLVVGRSHQGHILLEALREEIRDQILQFLSRDHFRIVRGPDSTYRLERLSGNAMWRVRPGERITVRKGELIPLAGGDIILLYTGATDHTPDGPGSLGTLFFNFCDAQESAVTMGTRDALVATGHSQLNASVASYGTDGGGHGGKLMMSYGSARGHHVGESLGEFMPGTMAVGVDPNQTFFAAVPPVGNFTPPPPHMQQAPQQIECVAMPPVGGRRDTAFFGIDDEREARQEGYSTPPYPQHDPSQSQFASQAGHFMPQPFHDYDPNQSQFAAVHGGHMPLAPQPFHDPNQFQFADVPPGGHFMPMCGAPQPFHDPNQSQFAAVHGGHSISAPLPFHDPNQPQFADMPPVGYGTPPPPDYFQPRPHTQVGTGTIMPHSMAHSSGTGCRTPVRTPVGTNEGTMFDGPPVSTTATLPAGGHVIPGTPPRGRNRSPGRRRDPIEDGPIDSIALQQSHASAMDSFGYGQVRPLSRERVSHSGVAGTLGVPLPFGLDEWRTVDSRDELTQTGRAMSPVSMKSLPGNDRFRNSGFHYY